MSARSDRGGCDRSPCSRRAFLAGIGIAATTPPTGTAAGQRREAGAVGSTPVGTIGVPGARQATVGSSRDRSDQRVRPQFGVELDAVADLGCDPSGAAASDRALEAGLADADAARVLVRFPAGEFRFEETHVISGFDALGFVGRSGETRFVAPPGFQRVWFRTDGIESIRFSGIDLDVRAEGCGPTLVAHAERTILLEDVTVLGRGEGDANALMPRIASPDGLGVIRRFVAPEGGVIGDDRIGIWVGPENRGTLRFEACRLEQFPNNGIYASASKGTIQVIGGAYRNNHVSQVRLSGPDCRVYGVYVEVDAEAYDGPGSPSEYRNARGIWWEAKRRFATGGVVEYTTVRVLSGPSVGGIVVAPNGGAITVRRSIVEVDVPDTHGIYAYPPTGGVYEVPPRPWRVRLENVHVHGVAGVPAVQVVDRARSTVSESCIDSGVAVTGSWGEGYAALAEGLFREGSRFVGARTGCLDREVGVAAARDLPSPTPPTTGTTTPLWSVVVHTLLLAAMLGVGALVVLGLLVAIGGTVRSFVDEIG